MRPTTTAPPIRRRFSLCVAFALGFLLLWYGWHVAHFFHQHASGRTNNRHSSVETKSRHHHDSKFSRDTTSYDGNQRYNEDSIEKEEVRKDKRGEVLEAEGETVTTSSLMTMNNRKSKERLHAPMGKRSQNSEKEGTLKKKKKGAFLHFKEFSEKLFWFTHQRGNAEEGGAPSESRTYFVEKDVLTSKSFMDVTVKVDMLIACDAIKHPESNFQETNFDLPEADILTAFCDTLFGDWDSYPEHSVPLYSDRCDIPRVDANTFPVSLFDKFYRDKKPIIFVDKLYFRRRRYETEDETAKNLPPLKEELLNNRKEMSRRSTGIKEEKNDEKNYSGGSTREGTQSSEAEEIQRCKSKLVPLPSGAEGKKVDSQGTPNYIKDEGMLGLTRPCLLTFAGHVVLTTTVGAGMRNHPVASQTLTLRKYITKDMTVPWQKDHRGSDLNYVTGDADNEKVNAAIAHLNLRHSFAYEKFLSRKTFLNGKDKFRRARSLIMGGSGSGTPYHKHWGAFAQTLFGMKRWFLRRPNQRRNHTEDDPDFRADETSHQFLLNQYKRIQAQKEKMSKPYNPFTAPFLECTIVPGETLYIPPRWWHATLNLGQTVAISIFELPEVCPSCGE